MTLLAVVALLSATTVSALAINSAGSGFWDVGATWVGGTVPTISDDATITNGCTVTIRTNTANNVKSLTIQTNGVLTHSANSTTALGERYKVVLNVVNNLTIDLGGEINVDGKGYDKKQGPGYSGLNNSAGGYGGRGGGPLPGTTYGSITSPTNIGSGGTRFYGGGAILLTVNGTSTVEGVISAIGAGNDWGPGSGGSVFLTTGTLMGDGAINVNGGYGNGFGIGSGGGGRVAVILTNSTDFAGVTMTAYTGGGNPSGAGGTVYREHKDHAPGQGVLIVDYNDRALGVPNWRLNNTVQNGKAASSYAFSEIILTNGGVYALDTDDTLDVTGTTIHGDVTDRNEGIYLAGGTLTVPQPLAWTNYFIAISHTNSTFDPGASLTVGTNATLKIDVPWTVNYPITLEPGGWMDHSRNSTFALGERYKINLTINGSLNIQTGAHINVDGMGFTKYEGPGEPTHYQSAAGYGGSGGNYSGGGGITYGSIVAPTNLGSGGNVYPGGGCVQLLVTGTTTVDGVISALGTGDNNSSGGSGGSIFLTTGTLLGNGTLSASGVSAAGNYSTGGGGRIAVILTNSTDFANVAMQAYGGPTPGSGIGGAGTVYRKTLAQGPGQGTLVIDAGNRVTGNPSYTGTTLINSSVINTVVGTVIITNKARLKIDTDQTLTVNGSWANEATFTANSNSAVVFAGTNTATITGHNTFYNLICTNANKILAFEDGKTNTVDGKLTLANATLDSTSGSASWYLEASANMHSVSNVTVGRSDARPGATIEAYDSTDQGGNFKWVFAESGFWTNTWTGTMDSDWNNTNNWSRNRTTIFTDTVVIPTNSYGNYPLLDFDKRMLSLTISNGASMSLNGYNLTVDENTLVAGTLTATGSETLTLGGDLDFSGGGVFNSANSTVLLPGSNMQSVVSAGNMFYQFTISQNAGQVTFVDAVAATNIVNLGTPLTFQGSVTVASDFRTQGTNVIFGGAVTIQDFYNETGALVFSGTVATVTFTNWQGDLTFRDDFSSQEFYCAPGGMDITFNAGNTYTIGNFEMYGQSGNTVQLRSSAASSWLLNVTNWAKVRQVDVQYSDASAGATIQPVASTDSGNNPNWNFGGPWKTWVGGVSAVFTNANNWGPVGVPSSSSHVLIDGYYTTAPILSGVATVAQVIVGGYTTATVTVNGHLSILENVEVLSEGTITHSANSTTALGERYKVVLNVVSNLTIDLGGQINADGKGYSNWEGPGEPAHYQSAAGHGGSGGNFTGGGGTTYGSITAPTNLGSGGNTYPGGGSVQLQVTGTTTVDGMISANGAGNNNSSGGSGGSIFLTTGTLAGNGTLRANGVSASGSYSTGGGGRIAVILTSSTDFANVAIQAYGGPSPAGGIGGAGTVYRKTPAQGPGQGTLVIDANNRVTGNLSYTGTTLISSLVTDTVVGTMTITNKARLKIDTDQSLTVNGSWANEATFIANSNSTVIFASTNTATITGNNPFYNLTAGAAGKTILFEAGKTNTVNGMLIFQDDTTLRSTLDDTQWWLTLSVATGTQLVGRVTVKDSNASGGQTILAGKASTDLKNNVNWWFPPSGVVIIIR